MRQLTHVDTREVSLVTRAANKRRFALLKADYSWYPVSKRDIPQSEREGMPEADFAGKDKSFPIRKPEDVAAAAHSLGRAGADNYSTDRIKANIIRIARRKGAAFVAQLPEAWKVQKGETVMPRALDLNDENIQAVLNEPLQGEDELIEKYAPGASEEVKTAMAASLRLMVAASEETGPEAIAKMAAVAFAKDDEAEEEERKRKEEEERKRKAYEAEEAERKRKEAEGAKMNAKRKAGKPFPGAKPPFGKPGDDDEEAERKRKEAEEEERKRKEAEEEERKSAVAKIAKLEADLRHERDLRLQKEAEAEAREYGYIPMPAARIATILRKADEANVKLAKADGKGEMSMGEAVREVFKAAQAAIEKAGVLGQRGSDLLGNPGGARERLNAMASERLTKADGKETFEQAFAAVVRANPALYTQYLREEHSSRR